MLAFLAPVLSFFGGGKNFIKIIVIIAIVTAIGGTIAAAKSYLNGLQDEIDTLTEQNTVLKVDKAKLEVSNASLESEIGRRETERADILREIETLRLTDRESRDRVIEFETRLNSAERRGRIDAIQERKATLLLRRANQQAECEWAHFDDFNGQCILGKWVPDGERFVPTEENQND